MKKFILAAPFLMLGAACKPEAPEPIPAPRAGESVAGSAASGSVKSEPKGGLLNMPGNYVRTTVGQVAKARAAKALFEKTETDQLKELSLTGAGGK